MYGLIFAKRLRVTPTLNGDEARAILSEVQRERFEALASLRSAADCGERVACRLGRLHRTDSLLTKCIGSVMMEQQNQLLAGTVDGAY